MSFLCSIGFHKNKPRYHLLAKPEPRVAVFRSVGHLFQHPSTWPKFRVPYIAKYEKIADICVRCGRRA